MWAAVRLGTCPSNKNCRSLERVAHDVPVPASAGRPQVQVQRLQGNRGSRASFGLVRFCRTKMEASQKEPTFPAGSMPEQAGETAPCTDEEKIGTEGHKRNTLRTRSCTDNLEQPLAMELRIRRLGWERRMAEQSQKDDPSHQQVLGGKFWANTCGQIPLHDEREETHNLGRTHGPNDSETTSICGAQSAKLFFEVGHCANSCSASLSKWEMLHESTQLSL